MTTAIRWESVWHINISMEKKENAFVHAIRDGFVRWKDFGGCSTISEFWYFILFEFAIFILTGLIHEVLMGFVFVVVFIPTLAISIRRLHDSDHSGWNYLWIFLPYIGILYFTYICCLPSKRDLSNHYWRDWCQYEMIKRSTE